jgi:hypothetical protein
MEERAGVNYNPFFSFFQTFNDTMFSSIDLYDNISLISFSPLNYSKKKINYKLYDIYYYIHLYM